MEVDSPVTEFAAKDEEEIASTFGSETSIRTTKLVGNDRSIFIDFLRICYLLE